MWAIVAAPAWGRPALPLLLLAVWLAVPTLGQSDVQLLLDFKSTFSNGDSVLSSWTDGSDPCGGSWQGVTCVGGRPSEM